MTPVVLVGLMVAAALVLAITWVEPRVLGGPATPAPGDAGASGDLASVGEVGRERPLEPVSADGPGDTVESSPSKAA